MDSATSNSERGKPIHPLTAFLHQLIQAKSSNLCVSADITSASAMLDLARKVGPSIVVFKTHADMLSGWDADPIRGTGQKLAAIAQHYGFLIFEDRKFADIGSTCQLQYVGGVHQIVTWAHIVNAHIISGPDVVRALHETAINWEKGAVDEESEIAGRAALISNEIKDEPFNFEKVPRERGLLLLAQMSSAGNFLDDTYTGHCVDIARKNRDFVMGFIAQKPLNSLPEDTFITMTPGCSLSPEESIDDSEFVPGAEDALGQQYNSPRSIIVKGCDIIIVGRGICNAANPAAKAEQYRKSAWEAYMERKTL